MHQLRTKPGGREDRLFLRISAATGSIASVAYSPDGTKIVSGSNDQTIKVWDAGAFWGPKCQFFCLS